MDYRIANPAIERLAAATNAADLEAAIAVATSLLLDVNGLLDEPVREAKQRLDSMRPSGPTMTGATPIELPTFSIPKDSPFAAIAPTTAAAPAAAASTEPFSFSFSLGTSAPTKSVATYDLAAAVVPSADVPAASGEARPVGVSTRISRRGTKSQRKNGMHDADDGQPWEEEWGGEEADEEWEEEELPAHSAASPPRAPIMSFDASKFDLKSFAASLPEPPPVPPA